MERMKSLVVVAMMLLLAMVQGVVLEVRLEIFFMAMVLLQRTMPSFWPAPGNPETREARLLIPLSLSKVSLDMGSWLAVLIL